MKLTDNPIEKLRLKWHSLWNGYKDYIAKKTGSGIDNLLDVVDTPPFLDEIMDIKSCTSRLHVRYFHAHCPCTSKSGHWTHSRQQPSGATSAAP